MVVEVRDPARDPALAARLLEVQHAAYAVEARLIGDDRIPALHEDLAGLTSAGLSWLVARDGTAVLGALGWQSTSDGVDVDRLVVDPAYARRGTGRALVAAVLDLAGDRPVTVSTGRDNTPARRLYARAGFREVAEREVLPGLWVVDLARTVQTPTTRSATTWS
ncbi:Acetyltransferase (GNAT) domain-containing protein [Geodermatophilus amargosae]|uniref:Acetyltransferase (GNAT) domain-containing protein n=1 Tax=Geodermatophilus amargosae TaxID=1296565 RepID=A0A1I6ZEG2_9ACTN|nr:GNAT family N-acetyltransferase [Geodermatophilus amargosae]SFT61073.1 Acetyltransferase (GNAT) domain-containing protein [Geodermatophilus amargosae]